MRWRNRNRKIINIFFNNIIIQKIKYRIKIYLLRKILSVIPAWLELHIKYTTFEKYRSGERLPLGIALWDMFLDIDRCLDNKKYMQFIKENKRFYLTK